MHGHVTQGRYGARLVEGNAYLLKLSRYVHLNPVKVAGMKSRPVQDRLAALEKYEWSSFPAYAGLAPRNGFVDYEPVLALLEGPKKGREGRYRQFVGAGVATDDEEFLAALWCSAHCIGSDDFREEVEDRYRALVGGQRASDRRPAPTSAIIWHCLKTIDLVYFHPYSGCRSQESADMSLGMRPRRRSIV